MKLQSECTMKKPIFINNNKNMIQMNEGDSRNNELPCEDDVEARKNLEQDNIDLYYIDISRAINLGVSLELKDFSKQFVKNSEPYNEEMCTEMEHIPVDGPFVKILFHNKKFFPMLASRKT